MLALVAPSAALAHATLVGTLPSNDAVLASPPKAVVLRFDEEISSFPDSVRVFDEDVERVETGSLETPDVRLDLRSDLPDDLANGTYVVAWHVLSADSHPIRGAFAFSVGGGPVANTADIVQAVLDQEADSESVDLALAITRYIGLALILFRRRRRILPRLRRRPARSFGRRGTGRRWPSPVCSSPSTPSRGSR